MEFCVFCFIGDRMTSFACCLLSLAGSSLFQISSGWYLHYHQPSFLQRYSGCQGIDEPAGNIRCGSLFAQRAKIPISSCSTERVHLIGFPLILKHCTRACPLPLSTPTISFRLPKHPCAHLLTSSMSPAWNRSHEPLGITDIHTARMFMWNFVYLHVAHQDEHNHIILRVVNARQRSLVSIVFRGLTFKRSSFWHRFSSWQVDYHIQADVG